MKCPNCGADDDKVLDSRPARNGAAVRRRRECSSCGRRYTTFEEIAADETYVVKTDGRREPFDRLKIDRAIRRACGKRPVSDDQIRSMTDDIVAAIPAGAEIKSSRIAELVMERLKETDDVAYIRFASVYRRFTDVAQFVAAITEMAKK
jgi:transcriptional repressor NrdR